MLRKNFFTAEQLIAMMRNYRQAGLEPDEVAVMAFAEKVVLQAHRVTEEDVQGLRGHGLTDAEILDVTLTASARSLFSKTLDAVGAEPDSVYLNLEPELRQALASGRPIPVSS